MPKYIVKMPIVLKAAKRLRCRGRTPMVLAKNMAEYLRKGKAVFLLESPKGARIWTGDNYLANSFLNESGYKKIEILKPIRRR